MQRLQEKVALVTGAGGGIGQAAALRFAAEGARVVVLDVRAEGVAATLALLADQGAESLSLRADLTQSEQVQQAIARILARWGRLDAVFNAAGASGRRHGDGPVDQCSETGWQWTLDVNLTSVFLVCKYALPALLQSKGAIVNLSSVLGMVGDEDFATHAYAASKAGIIGLSRAMASHYAARGVRVNVIAPGLIATPMSQRAQSDPRILARLEQLQPLTGTLGTPEDVAAAAAYLISDDARFLTGVILPVDGGWTAR